MTKETTSGGVGLCTVLLVVFVVLKLTNLIDWPWIWVLSPFWIPLALVAGIIVVLILVGLVAAFLGIKK